MTWCLLAFHWCEANEDRQGCLQLLQPLSALPSVSTIHTLFPSFMYVCCLSLNNTVVQILINIISLTNSHLTFLCWPLTSLHPSTSCSSFHPSGMMSTFHPSGRFHYMSFLLCFFFRGSPFCTVVPKLITIISLTNLHLTFLCWPSTSFHPCGSCSSFHPTYQISLHQVKTMFLKCGYFCLEFDTCINTESLFTFLMFFFNCKASRSWPVRYRAEGFVTLQCILQNRVLFFHLTFSFFLFWKICVLS